MTTSYLPQTTSDVVIDLSHWEAPVDFAQVKASGIAAVILKATQGTGFVDPTFAARAVGANDAGLLVGAYHFFDTSDPTAQAGYFLATVARTGVPMLMTLDFEPSATSQTVENNAAVILSMVKSMVGIWPVLYTGRCDWLRHSLTFSNVRRCSPNTVQARFVRQVGRNGNCGQHTDGHIGNGVVPVPGVGRCDRERFVGTTSHLAQWWRNPTP
jgi:lysozyme